MHYATYIFVSHYAMLSDLFHVLFAKLLVQITYKQTRAESDTVCAFIV